MTLFILSLVPLLAGPFVVRSLQAVPSAVRGLDAFVLVSVGGIVLVHVFPASIAAGGFAVLVAIVVGLTIPLLADRTMMHGKGRVRGATLAAGLAALAVHGILDGVALAAPVGGVDRSSMLAIAVVLHRLPVGLAVWWLVRPRLGTWGAVAVVAVLAAASCSGFAFSLAWPVVFDSRWWFIIQALLMGTLLHIVVHQFMSPAAEGRGAGMRPAWAVGGLLGLAMLVLAGIFVPH